MLFVVLACHKQVLGEFDQLLNIFCTAHTLSSALLLINLINIKKCQKLLGTHKVKHRATGREARMISTVLWLCRPPCSNALFVDALGGRNSSADGVPTWQSGACGFKSHQWLGFNLFTLSIALKCFSGSLLKSSTTNFASCKIFTSADWVEPSLKQNEQTINI